MGNDSSKPPIEDLVIDGAAGGEVSLASLDETEDADYSVGESSDSSLAAAFRFISETPEPMKRKVIEQQPPDAVQENEQKYVVPQLPKNLRALASSPKRRLVLPKETMKVDWNGLPVHEQARFHLFVTTMILAYASYRDSHEKHQNRPNRSCTANYLLKLASKTDGTGVQRTAYSTTMSTTRTKPYPKDVWKVFQRFAASDSRPHVPADLYIHTIEVDEALGEFVFGILVSPSSACVWVVFGSPDHRRMGQGLTEYKLRPKGNGVVVVGVDGYWGDRVLGRGGAICKDILKKLKYDLPIKDIGRLIVCGYGGGGALAKIVGVYLAVQMEGLVVSPQIWSYGAPRVGNLGFYKLHSDMEQAGELYHVRITNVGDSFPRFPLLAWDDLFGFWSVGMDVALPQPSQTTQDYPPHSLGAYWERLICWSAPLPLESWYEQTKRQRNQAKKQRKRRLVILMALLVVYVPIVYLWMNPDVLQIPSEQGAGSDPSESLESTAERVCMKEGPGRMCMADRSQTAQQATESIFVDETLSRVVASIGIQTQSTDYESLEMERPGELTIDAKPSFSKDPIEEITEVDDEAYSPSEVEVEADASEVELELAPPSTYDPHSVFIAKSFAPRGVHSVYNASFFVEYFNEIVLKEVEQRVQEVLRKIDQRAVIFTKSSEQRSIVHAHVMSKMKTLHKEALRKITNSSKSASSSNGNEHP